MPTRVFVSHSSEDRALARRFVDAVEAGLPIQRQEIRCTSLPETALPVGTNVSDSLKREIDAADVIVGLLTPKSLKSSYVLFELGAAWGVGKRTMPLLAKGVRKNSLPSIINELSCERLSDAQKVTFVIKDLGQILDLKLDSLYSPDCQKAVRSVLQVAKPSKKKPDVKKTKKN